jgi:hypothetical protein
MRARPLLVAVVLALAPALVRAASERELTFEALVGAADEIVVGEVERTSARFEGRLIVTDAVVRVDETLKGGGGASRKITITQLGGTAVHPRIGAPVTMDVSGQARLAPHETVVLFVEQPRPGRRQLVGGAQGKLLVHQDPASGQATVPVGPKRLRVARDAGGATVAAEPTSLDALRARIRAIVGGSVR